MFFQDIPESERERYGYSQMLLNAKLIDQARANLFKEKEKKREKFAGLLSTLGIKRDIVDDEDIQRLEANRDEQHKMLLYRRSEKIEKISESV